MDTGPCCKVTIELGLGGGRAVGATGFVTSDHVLGKRCILPVVAALVSQAVADAVKGLRHWTGDPVAICATTLGALPDVSDDSERVKRAAELRAAAANYLGPL